MRHFANPMYFYRKIDDGLEKISLAHFNNLLGMAKLEPFSDALQKVDSLSPGANYHELQNRLIQQYEILDKFLTNISPYSWYGDRAERFAPSNAAKGYWDVFRHNIELSGSGLYNSIKKHAEKIEISLAKIFLITGMAGQGKTNFICDLFENQFRVFEIPAVFIPGRSLNDYKGPNRIFSYIKNNRFAPGVSNPHELLSLLNDVAKEYNKPFVIAIDGINEVGALNEFNSELGIFLDSLCQYDFIKIIITCRNEFFEQKFSRTFESVPSKYLYQVRDLRREMSEHNKLRLVSAYLRHFRIIAKFSSHAKNFLENDLILLRIFSEINEGMNIGYVTDIYKGDIFDQYLQKKIKEFPQNLRQKVINTLFGICERMLHAEDFSQISLVDNDEQEHQIIGQLIREDIILRREVPSEGFSMSGIENISFTYDELRDFLLASYTIDRLGDSNPHQASMIFDKLSNWPIYEGYFRYSYILARKRKCKTVLAICEASKEFQKHFINNLSLLSADIQTTDDVRRITSILSESNLASDVQQVAWFLFKKRNNSEVISIHILIEHVNKLNDSESELFMSKIFHDSRNYIRSRSWHDEVSEMLNDLKRMPEDEKLKLGAQVLALTIHFAPHARWPEREDTMNFFAGNISATTVRDAVELCRSTASQNVRKVVNDILTQRHAS